jgi:hypothetical protein
MRPNGYPGASGAAGDVPTEGGKRPTWHAQFLLVSITMRMAARPSGNLQRGVRCTLGSVYRHSQYSGKPRPGT